MAGVHFSFYDFPSLLKLNMGIADRLDENRAESFTVLFCDLSHYSPLLIKESLQSVLRDSDSIVHYKQHYFFVLPYTDKYGAEVVNKMLHDFFSTEYNSVAISYPIDGENPQELIDQLQFELFQQFKLELDCFDGSLFTDNSAMLRNRNTI